MTPEDIAPLFTRDNGSYLFARWGRPIAPVVFGVDDATLAIVKGALEAVCALAGHQTTEHDPELGVNLMMFFFSDWSELLDTPDLDRLVPDLAPLVDRLSARDANQYRLFRFDEEGAIRAAFVFIRMDDALGRMPAADLALTQAVQTILLWSESAFAAQSPLASVDRKVILRPDIAGLIRAGYDPVMPAVATDPSHALRLSARLNAEGLT